MLMFEDQHFLSMIPSNAGKIVGIASYRGDYILLACEYALYKVYDNGIELMAVQESSKEPQ